MQSVSRRSSASSGGFADIDAYFLSLGEGPRPRCSSGGDKSVQSTASSRLPWTLEVNADRPRNDLGYTEKASLASSPTVTPKTPRTKPSSMSRWPSPGTTFSASMQSGVEDDQEFVSVSDVTRDLLDDARRLAGSSRAGERHRHSTMSFSDRSATSPMHVRPYGLTSETKQQRSEIQSYRHNEVSDGLAKVVQEQRNEIDKLRVEIRSKNVELRGARQSAEEEQIGSRALRRALEDFESRFEQEVRLRKAAEAKLANHAVTSNAFEETRRGLHKAQHERDVASKEAKRANKLREEESKQYAESNATLRAKVAKLEKDNARLTHSLERNELALSEATNKQGELSAARQRHVEELEKELNEALMRARDLASTKDHAESRLLQLQGVSARAQLFSERLEEAEEELDDLRKTCSAAQKMEREVLGQCRNLETQLQAMENNFASAEARAIQAEAQLEALVHDRSNRAVDRVELDRIRVDLQSTKTSVQNLSDEKNSLAKKLAASEKSKQILMDQMHECQRALQIIQLRLTQICSTGSPGYFGNNTDSGHEPIDSTDNNTAKMEEDALLLEMSKLARSEVLGVLQPVLRSLSALEKLHLQIKKQLHSAESKLESGRKESQEVSLSVTELETQIRRLETENAQIRDRLRQKQTELAEQTEQLQEAHHCVVALEGELYRDRDAQQRMTHSVRRRLLRAQLDCLTGSVLVRPPKDLANYDVEDNLADLAETVARLLDQKSQAAEINASRVKDLESRLYMSSRDRLSASRIGTPTRGEVGMTSSSPQLLQLPGSNDSRHEAAPQSPYADKHFRDTEVMLRALRLAMLCLQSALVRLDQIRSCPVFCSHSMTPALQDLYAWSERLFSAILPSDVSPNPFKRTASREILRRKTGTKITFRTLVKVVVCWMKLRLRVQRHTSNTGAEVLRGLGLPGGQFLQNRQPTESELHLVLNEFSSDSSDVQLWNSLAKAFAIDELLGRKHVCLLPKPEMGQMQVNVDSNVSCQALKASLVQVFHPVEEERRALEDFRHALMYYENELGRELESWRSKAQARASACASIPILEREEQRENVNGSSYRNSSLIKGGQSYILDPQDLSFTNLEDDEGDRTLPWSSTREGPVARQLLSSDGQECAATASISANKSSKQVEVLQRLRQEQRDAQADLERALEQLNTQIGNEMDFPSQEM